MSISSLLCDNMDLPQSFYASEHQLTVIKGGLAIVFPLQDSHMHMIFGKLVEVDFNTDFLEPEAMESAKCVMNSLFETPSSLLHYITKQRIYTSLSWAADKLELEKTACTGCTVSMESNTEGVYVIRMDAGFCAHNEIRANSLLLLTRYDDEFRRVIRGRVLDYDPASSMLRFAPFGWTKKIIEESAIYEISMIPSSLMYRSRCRTLMWLQSLNREELVFPKPTDSMLPIADYERAERDIIPRMKFSRELNEYQKKAVYGIVSGHHGTLPYIVHGPPGTGKTTVLVEAINLLIKDKRRKVRIIVCTPSNTAADWIALELLKKARVPENQMFRMYSLMRPVEAQNKELRNISCIEIDDDGEEVYGIPSVEKLMQKSVIVCTLGASTFLVSGGLNGKFTHIFIDEAGQANDVDTLIPMVGLSSNETRIVLAGDPKQLGPVEPIDYLNKHGFNESLMERFSKQECYAGDSRITCMLQINYRSHPSIIRIPSDLFYDCRLSAADVVYARQKSLLVDWCGLPKKGFPIIFHHLVGKDVIEPNGFSYRNEDEAEQILNYVRHISTSLDVKLEDIGVISPYKYQVRLLREMLSDYPDVTIDTVERFQGSERRVILVSAVRNDRLGFVGDDKRFNTTIMRAEELLIVVGNCENLLKNYYWQQFINYCDDNRAIVNRPQRIDLERANYGDVCEESPVF